MKQLILIRHAKSSWKDKSLPDHDRPLNKRGRRDAPLMASYLAESLVDKGLGIDALLCSTAVRAKTTADEFAEACGLPAQESNKLYTFDGSQLFAAARTYDDNLTSITIVGHNPALWEFTSDLTGEFIESFPTCSIAIVHCKIDTWADIGSRCGELISFFSPKSLG